MLRRLTFVVALTLAACSPAPETDGFAIATTVSPITNIVANIACGAAAVTGLVPEGTNSHTFEPPPSAARSLASADVVFVNGLKLEDPTRELAEETETDVVSLGDKTITPDQYLYDFSFPKEAGKPNPHLWTNPVMAKRYAEVIAETVAAKDPSNASTYAKQSAAYTAKIDAFDAALREATATVAPENRKLLTYHDAYAYFAKEYGWTVVGAVQVSNFEEPTAHEVARLITQIREQRVPAIFGSEVFASPVLKQIASESGARYVAELRDDDLPGKPGDAQHSYLGLMRFDYVTIVRALGGNPSALEALDVADVARDCARYPQ